MLDFVDLVRGTCRDLNVEVRLVPNEIVYLPRTGEACAGYFDDTLRVMAVAAARSDWSEILAHEFSHVNQFADGQFSVNGEDPYEALDYWYSGSDLPSGKAAEYMRFVMACEHDAERRSLSYLSRFGLSSDIKSYIRNANGYVVRHLFALKHRKWPGCPDWGTSVSDEEITPLSEVMLTRQIEKLIKTTCR